jgi:mono/diheme cytochrome c family protein
MSVVRAALAAIVLVVMGCAIAGVGMGEAPAEREPPPDAAQVAATQGRLAAGGAGVRRGRELFGEQGCDRCHSIAAIDAGGLLGPRLDTLDDDLDENLESIAEPRHDIVDGYPEQLMPADFGERLSDAELRALAVFVTAVGRGEDGGGRGRGRGRGRGHSGGD